MSKLENARLKINEIDKAMADLFKQRMDAVKMVAEYKKEHGLPIEDLEREAALLENNSAYLNDEEYRSHYVDFLKSTMEISKEYQRRLLGGKGVAYNDAESALTDNAIENNTIITVKSHRGSYDVNICRGILSKGGVSNLINLNRKVLIVTDSGVPSEYSQAVASASQTPVVITIPQGEGLKNIESYLKLLSALVENNFTRSDCVVAVGGGVVGDLAGFVASTYMRGIEFYNIPTTVLSQVDSSIGGKTAVDFMSIKNIVGAFYPPKKVIIDVETLKTLPKRQISNGLAEALKMACTHDAELFKIFEDDDAFANLERIIIKSLNIKKSVVEADENESNLRKVLNFGHTLAHGIESALGMETYYHGECVAMGMLPMCSAEVRERLIKVLKKLSLPTEISSENLQNIISACEHDKKISCREITLVYVPKIGEFQFIKMPFSHYEKLIKEGFLI